MTTQERLAALLEQTFRAEANRQGSARGATLALADLGFFNVAAAALVRAIEAALLAEGEWCLRLDVEGSAEWRDGWVAFFATLDAPTGGSER